MKEQLLHLTSLCIDKGLCLELCPYVRNVRVFNISKMKQIITIGDSYYDGKLINYSYGYTLPLNELIKLVEDYEK